MGVSLTYMAGGSSDELRAHIESISSRSTRDAQALTDRLSGRAWPGGQSDRTQPAALAWLRRWRASGPAPLAELCGCAQGRCLVCN
jgi:hypothetical protein